MEDNKSGNPYSSGSPHPNRPSNGGRGQMSGDGRSAPNPYTNQPTGQRRVGSSQRVPDANGASQHKASDVRNRQTSQVTSSGGAPRKQNAASSEQKSKQKQKKTNGHPVLRRFGIFICSVFLIGLVSVSTVGLYALKYVSSFVNGDVAIDLDEYKANQSQTTILYTLDDDGNEMELIRLHGEENRIWVDLEEMPKDLQNAFIALEDRRFKEHSGVDWTRTIAVMIVPSYEGQGGSTITQQLIKNLTGERDVTYIRKFNEIKNALNLEKHYSKETILEAYLNTLYLDAGCYGVQTASEYYFGKNVSELNLAECACIAAITNAPRTYDPILNPENNAERMKYCLECMLNEGYITQDEFDKALAYDLVFTTDDDYVPKTEEEKKPSDGMIDVNESNVGQDGEEEKVQSYYVDYVINKVIEDLMDTRAYTYEQAWRLVYYGGLKIHVAVDLDIQNSIEDIYYNRKGFPSATNSYGEQVQSSMVIMDYTGRVVAIVGQAGEKTGARCLNIATDSKRQPGSSIKPLSVYSLAIDSGEYTWSYPMIQNYGILVNGERWPYNFGGDPGSAYSYETIQQALAPSHNTVPAQLVQALGVDTCYNWLKDKFKITSLDDADKDYSALAVGGMTHGVYGIEMCAAYTTFGNGGIYYEPYCYYTVTNSSGSVVYLTHNDSGEQIMKPGTAGVMNKLLQTVATSYNGTARAYKVDGFEMFAKTGTTSDEKDRWFIGGTPYYVCAVWMGYSQHAEELSFSTNYCGQLYQTVMNSIHKNLPAKSFEFGDEIVEKYYCTNTGLLASSACPSAAGWYRTDSLPSTCTSCGSYQPPVNNDDDETPDDTPVDDTPANDTPANDTPADAPANDSPAPEGGE